MSINISKIKKDLISIRSNYKKSQYKTLTLNKSKQDKKYIVPTFNHYKAKYLIINNPEKKQQKTLDEYSERIYTYANQYFSDNYDLIKEQFSILGKVSSRVKTLSSIKAKLTRVFKNTTEKISYKQALSNVGDAIGWRLVVSKEQKIQPIVDKLCELINKDELKVTILHNYVGENGQPYFSEKQVNQIQLTMKKKYPDIEFIGFQGQEIKKSGYTTTQMMVILKNGIQGELQIRGEEIQRLAEIEHLYYDIDLGKPTKYPELKAIVSNMTQDQKKLYNIYLSNLYNWARKKEHGEAVEQPSLPINISPELSYDSLKKKHDA